MRLFAKCVLMTIALLALLSVFLVKADGGDLSVEALLRYALATATFSLTRNDYSIAVYVGGLIGGFVLNLDTTNVYCKACNQYLGTRWKHKSPCPRCLSNRTKT